MQGQTFLNQRGSWCHRVMVMGVQELSDIDEDASDVQSLVSTDDSAVSSAASDGSDDVAADSDGAGSDGPESSADSDTILRPRRKAPHTHTLWENEYFVLTNNTNYNDVRGRLVVSIPSGTCVRVARHQGA